MGNKWIFQKNISSTKLIEGYLDVLKEMEGLDKDNIVENLKWIDAYKGRSEQGSLSTLGVRFSQMCFYMFGYKNSNAKFIPTQTTINILKKSDEKSKNMLVNLFAIQYPHPYSNTNPDIKIYAGRLIVKLLCEEVLEKKLYIDEIIYFLPFIKTITIKEYQELVASIVEYRKLSYEAKQQLFKNEDNYESLFANCLHEWKYYFLKIYREFGVLDFVADKTHNGGNVFYFKHGSDSVRNDAILKGGPSGYVKLNEIIYQDAQRLLSAYQFQEKPESLEDSNVYSKDEWIHDLYEVDILKYLSIVCPKYDIQKEIIETISNMQYLSKFSSIDGKEFELSLKPVLELFRENLDVNIISGSGATDLLCVFEDQNSNCEDYKVNIEAKSRNSANNMNVIRIKRHLETHKSKYCIIIAPRFSKGNDLDIIGFNMVSITAETFGKYISKECLSSTDGKAEYSVINDLIQENLGKNISAQVEKIIESKYGM